MSMYNDLCNGKAKLSLVGLGYVGMPIAVEFAKHVKVVGYDLNKAKIEQYKQGVDPTNEVGDAAVAGSTVEFTADPAKLEERPVTLGRSSSEYIEILDGLEEGETVYVQNIASNAMAMMMGVGG